jgi:hypothetical protein
MTRSGFYRIAADPTGFDFGEFNLAKVFHTYYYFERSPLATQAPVARGTRFGPVAHLLRRLFSSIKGLFVVIRLGLAGRPRPRVLFYGTSGRPSRVGDTLYDLYNARIVAEGGREQFVIIEDSDDRAGKTYRPDFHLGDFGLPIRALGKLYQLLFRRCLAEYADRIAAGYPGLGLSRKEVVGIAGAFYSNYQMDRFLLSILRPSQALLICHYGREPFIAACRRHGIPVTELQHGTLSGHPF